LTHYISFLILNKKVIMKDDILLISVAVVLLIMMSLGFILFMIAYQKKRIGLVKAALEAEQQLKEVELQNEIDLKQTEINKLQALNKERERISADLHDEMGSSLSSIKLMAQMLKSKIHSEAEKKELNEIIESCGSLNGSMREMIWSLNTNNDSLASFTLYLSQYARNFFEPSNIKINIQNHLDLYDAPLTSDVRRNIFLACKEILNNVLKHAKAQHVIISIEFLKPNKCQITIEDDGVGLPESHHEGNGLGNIQRRLKSIQGNHHCHNKSKGLLHELVFQV
jgi:two-component system, NarL family, sensor histidine kinase DesK